MEFKLSSLSKFELAVLTEEAKTAGKDVNAFMAEYFFNLAMCANDDLVCDTIADLLDKHIEAFESRFDEFEDDESFCIAYTEHYQSKEMEKTPAIPIPHNIALQGEKAIAEYAMEVLKKEQNTNQ